MHFCPILLIGFFSFFLGGGFYSQNGLTGWISVKPVLKHHFSSLPVPFLSWLLPVAGTGVLVPMYHTQVFGLFFLRNEVLEGWAFPF